MMDTPTEPKTVIALTGSIGMGKTTTAKLFAEAGVPTWDADAAVHKLYNEDQDAIAAIGKLCPAATRYGVVDRGALKEWIAINPDGFSDLEQIVHPRIATDRLHFLETNPAQIVLLDIPLLFEVGLSNLADFVVVVTAPADVQKERVLARGIMTEAQFEVILSKQMPDAEKRERADFVIETISLEHTRDRVQSILKEIKEKARA
jgi:dephospho-CoA kinase